MSYLNRLLHFDELLEAYFQWQTLKNDTLEILVKQLYFPASPNTSYFTSELICGSLQPFQFYLENLWLDTRKLLSVWKTKSVSV